MHSGRRRLSDADPTGDGLAAMGAPAVGLHSAAPAQSGLACADCQAATRKLGFKQFCQLEYAVRATVLTKLMADDWTRFDVDVQDIFKSPASASSMLLNNNLNSFTSSNYIDNSLLLQADEPQAPTPAAANRTGAAQEPAGLELAGGQQQSAASTAAAHRFKVGSVQSIWVPTEDVTCKCPRLKVKSTYLLMGKCLGRQWQTPMGAPCCH